MDKENKQKAGFKSKGFTMFEGLIVTFIVGVIAIVAVPSAFEQMERVRAQEGINVLEAVAAAQRDYRAQHFVYAEDVTDLVGFETPTMKNFDSLAVSSPVALIECPNPTNEGVSTLIKIESKDRPYWLVRFPGNDEIMCYPENNSSYCEKLKLMDCQDLQNTAQSGGSTGGGGTGGSSGGSSGS